MAIEATPIEVWIEWRQRPRAAVVVPYVRTQEKGVIDYEVLIRRQGSSGSTEVRQTGDSQVQPNLPERLGEVLIDREKGDECTVSVRVERREPKPKPKPVERSFDCPLVR